MGLLVSPQLIFPSETLPLIPFDTWTLPTIDGIVLVLVPILTFPVTVYPTEIAVSDRFSTTPFTLPLITIGTLTFPLTDIPAPSYPVTEPDTVILPPTSPAMLILPLYIPLATLIAVLPLEEVILLTDIPVDASMS